MEDASGEGESAGWDPQEQSLRQSCQGSPSSGREEEVSLGPGQLNGTDCRAQKWVENSSEGVGLRILPQYPEATIKREQGGAGISSAVDIYWMWFKKGSSVSEDLSPTEIIRIP
jgi:hypothetical protein